MASNPIRKQPGVMAGKSQFNPGPVAVYGQLASVLRAKIRSGEWAAGHELPSLDELCEEYGVARVTARQAIQVLIGEGLVSSARGRRTTVTFESSRPDAASLFGNFGLLETAPNYTVDVLSVSEVPSLVVGGWYKGSTEGEFVRIQKVDSESGQPYAYSECFVPTRIYKRFREGAIKRAKIARLVANLAKPAVAAGRERFLIGMADVAEAQHLQCPVGSPVARVTRIFIDEADQICYLGNFVYRGDLYCHDRDITEYIK